MTNLMNRVCELDREVVERIMEKTIGPAWRREADIRLDFLKRHGSHFNNGVLKRQLPYVQKKIRRNFDWILKIEEETSQPLSVTDFEKILNRIQLNPSLISRPDFLLCIDDLKTEAIEKIENEYSNFLLPIAFPTVFPPYTKNIQSVEEIASEQQLKIEEISKEREFYGGCIMATDSHKILVSCKESTAFVLYWWDLPSNPKQVFPTVGVQASVKFLDGKITEFKFGHPTLKTL